MLESESDSSPPFSLLAKAKRVAEIFLRFLGLGLTSFGGPTAHIGYFHRAFVERLRWTSEDRFASTVALCQFLPGPGSSQVGFALGLERAGLLGGAAAFLGFTLPSFLLMLFLATLDVAITGSGAFQIAIAALKLVAVAVVAHAVLAMARQFFVGAVTLAIGAATTLIMLLAPGLLSQMLVLLGAAAVGALLLRSHSQEASAESDARHRPSGVSRSLAARLALVLFALILLGLPWLAGLDRRIELFSDLARVGSLVFGGGHVVLPLLQASLDGIGQDSFLTGYAAAQGVPGPMFTLGTYLGAVWLEESPLMGALLATLGIFLPGFLLVIGLRERWLSLSQVPALAGAFAGLNAAVVGLLLAAFINPVLTSAVTQPVHALIAILGFVALRYLKIGVVWLVLGALVASGGLALL